MSSHRAFKILLAAFSGGVLLGAPLRSAEPPGSPFFEALDREVHSLFEKCRDAVVKIEATDDHGPLSGTGFFIDPNGMLYTCYSVGGESRDIYVQFKGTRYPATRLVADSRSGVALLKIEAETPFLAAGASQRLSVASPVMTIGYPMDLPPTPSFGIVGGFNLKYLGRYFATTHIRANVAVQRGEGGAPLLNMNGEAVGVLISSLDRGSASFVLPIEAAEKVRRDFVRFRELRPGYIGIQVGEGKTPVNGSTALVQDLVPGAPGAKAGIKPGDVLLRVAAHRITSPEDVLDACYYLTAEDDLTIAVERGGQQLEIAVQAADHPRSDHSASNTLGSMGDLRLLRSEAEQ